MNAVSVDTRLSVWNLTFPARLPLTAFTLTYSLVSSRCVNSPVKFTAASKSRHILEFDVGNKLFTCSPRTCMLQGEINRLIFSRTLWTSFMNILALG